MLERNGREGIEVDAITQYAMQAGRGQGDAWCAEKVLERMMDEGTEVERDHASAADARASHGDVLVRTSSDDERGIEVDAIRSTLMQATRVGDVRGAEKVLERMMDAKGIEANAITYNTLMQAYASQGDVRGARRHSSG